MLLLTCENKKKGGSEVLKVNHIDFVKTFSGKDSFELPLKNFVKKHLCYLKYFNELLWKDVFLNELLVQKKNLCEST